jgi:EAL domain-containing protein (putative c-di-GMP-specific phosphodiesterase class I)
VHAVTSDFTLWIDRSFIRDLDFNPYDVSIVRAIVSLAHELGLKVVAEGVETAEQLAVLHRMGCDQYQGYFHCAAVAPADVEVMLTPRGTAAAAGAAHWAESTYPKLASL